MDEVVGTVVDVQEDQVVGRSPGLGDGAGDVGDDHGDPGIGQQRRPVGDGAGAHPVDQVLLDLHDGRLLDPRVGQHLREGEPEAEAADDDGARLRHQPQGSGRQGTLGADLDGVHHEDPVGAQLQSGRRGVVGGALPQDQLASCGLGARELDVLHGDILPRRGDPPQGWAPRARGLGGWSHG